MLLILFLLSTSFLEEEKEVCGCTYLLSNLSLLGFASLSAGVLYRNILSLLFTWIFLWMNW